MRLVRAGVCQQVFKGFNLALKDFDVFKVAPGIKGNVIVMKHYFILPFACGTLLKQPTVVFWAKLALHGRKFFWFKQEVLHEFDNKHHVDLGSTFELR